MRRLLLGLILLIALALVPAAQATPPWAADNTHYVKFVDAVHGFGIGEQSLYATSDGGTTWRAVYDLPDGQPLAAFDAIDTRHVWFAEEVFPADWDGWRDSTFNTILHRSSDGGATWQTIHVGPLTWPQMPQCGWIYELDFADPLHGWAVVHEPDEDYWSGILATSDGGLSWHWQLRVAYLWITDFAMRNARIGQAMIGRQAYSTQDGGQHWVPRK